MRGWNDTQDLTMRGWNDTQDLPCVITGTFKAHGPPHTHTAHRKDTARRT